MPQEITETATLQCSQGTSNCQLTVTSQNFCFIENKLIATEEDKQSGVNIKPFGMCRLKPTSGGFLPCVPIPVAWKSTMAKDEINGCKILLDSSTCPCSSGGEIRIIDKGHNGNHEAG
jgi:hypothetical protein